MQFKTIDTTMPGTRTVEAEVEYYNQETDEKLKLEIHELGATLYGTTATDDEIETALVMLEELVCDPDFAHTGRRNHDAVNLCIAVHVLGYDERELIDQLEDKVYLSDADEYLFDEHVDRVLDYVDSWGPKDNMGKAIGYAIN